MNDNVKRDNRKAMPKFLLIILGSALIGGLIGGASVVLYQPVMRFFERLVLFIGMTGHIIQFAWVAVCASACFGLYFMAKRSYKMADPDSDDATDRADELISWALLVSSCGVIVSCFWFTATLTSPFMELEMMLIAIGGLLLAMAVFTVSQMCCVNLVRRMNPEKRGSVLDLDFSKKWMDSCDEAEQLITYKCGFKAYKAGVYACLAAWFVIILVYVNTEKGALLPCALVLGIWLVQTIVYCLEAIKLEHKR